MVYKTNFKNSGGFKNRFIIETKVLVTIYFNSYHKMLHTIVCGMDKDYVDRIIYTVYLDRKGPEKWVGNGEQEIIFQIFVKYEASQGYGYCYF